jgi:hypothetical protein
VKHLHLPVVLALAAVALLVSASAASAQETTSFTTASKFEVNGQVFEAGHYTLRFRNDMLEVVPQKGAESDVPILSRMAGPGGNPSEPRIVFDKADGMLYLSELWLPGQDGFLFRYTVEKHTHVIVNLKKGEGR